MPDSPVPARENIPAPAPDAQPQMPAIAMLPEAAVDAINLNIARRFVDMGPSFLHEVVRYAGRLQTCGESEAQKLKETGLNLRPVAEECCIVIDELRKLLEGDCSDEISNVVSSRLSPLMAGIQGMIEGAYRVRAELAEDDQQNKKAYRILSSIASTLRYRACDPSLVDVRDLLVRCFRQGTDLRIDDVGFTMCANPDDLVHLFLTVETAVEEAVKKVKDDIVSGIKGREAGSEQDHEQARGSLRELCVAPSLLCISAGISGEIKFRRNFSADVHARLQGRDDELSRTLELACEIAEFYGGSFEWDIDPEAGFRGWLRLPMDVRYSQAGVMRKVTAERSFIASDGSVRKYEIEAAGAAFINSEAYAQFCRALEYADALAELVPALDSLELHAYGTAGNILETYEKGGPGAVFGGPFRTPARTKLGILGAQLAWEEGKTEAREADKRHGVSFSHKERFLEGVRLLRFDEGLFGNEELLALVKDVCQRAEPLQLSLDFSIEAQRVILPDLCRVLDEVQACHSQERLGVLVCGIDYVDGARGDAILSLEVLSEAGEMIAKGGFSNSEGRFKYRTHNPQLSSLAADRIIAAVKAAQEQGEVTFRKLDLLLQGQNVELSENLIMDIVKECSRFVEMEEPEAALAWYVNMRLNQAEVETTEEGDKIRVSKIEAGDTSE